ncbi:alpha/beta fold hydrolase [Actinacidiphila yeochonensis]|uniref:alpha/beta fold hydrolase n=1 Tax=Actinacidiphila yeochonensis TaxID=89050 RepID=UPI00099B8D90|nr:alpha/beta hydrolase [Actinacidiphila yeochonensis]
MLLLHGLLGHTSHWTETARRLSPRYRVISLDQRGHGQKCSPASYTEESYVQDALAAVEQLGLAPAVLVGHGTGALTAWACAASRPDLVAAVVVCEMRAAAVGESMQRSWAQWFESWPLPFASLGEVRAYFGGQEPCPGLPPSVSSEFFAQMMARTEDGWRPPHAAEHLLRSQDAWIAEPHWDELANVRCPALVVRGVEGLLGRAEAQEMVRVLPRGSYAEIPDAGHLAPWEHPEAWCDAIEGFLTTALEPQPGPCPV